MKKSIYIVSSGGYRNIDEPRAFNTLKEARKYLKIIYESIRDDYMEDHEYSEEYCTVEKDFVEVYFPNMSCEEPWTARIDRVTIDIG